MPQFRKLLALALFAASASANAVVIDFDLTFDGTDISVDAGSAVPAGSVLNDGDSFDLTLNAAGNDFWRVEGAFNDFVPLSFFVLDSADRTADIETVFLLDGVEVFSISDTGVLQQFVHIGAQIWDLAAGLEFDSVEMRYDLLSSSASTEIQAETDIFGFQPFFRDGLISYNVQAVPEPGTLLLLGLGLAGMGMARRKQA